MDQTPPSLDHELYKNCDPDAPDCIKDRNGEVVLGLCRRCGKGEIELSGRCDPPSSPFDRMTAEQRSAVEAIRARRHTPEADAGRERSRAAIREEFPPRSPAPAPECASAALDAIAADLGHLTWDCGEHIVEGNIDRAVARIEGVSRRLKADGAPPLAAWKRLALADPSGRLLWRMSPPGAWPAEGPHEALTWPDVDAFHAWAEGQSVEFRARLAVEGWRLVELATVARPLSDVAAPIAEARAS